jgi:hypothetical protein
MKQTYLFAGTSIYAVSRASVVADQKKRMDKAIEAVIAAFPTVRHFESAFINKPDTVTDWYV